MRQYLGASDLANEVRMRRSRWHGAFLLVEGSTDSLVYGRFVHRESILVAHGKQHVIECLGILVQGGFTGVAAVVDRDMWILGEGEPPELDGLLCTDGRDLESMMLRSRALDNMLHTLGSPEKIQKIAANGNDPVDILLRAASELGYLRWLCERDRRASERGEQSTFAHDGPLRLRFQELTFSRFTDARTLTIDRVEMLSAVSNHSRQPIHLDRIQKALDELRELAQQRGHTLWGICAGHDLVELLRIGLHKLLGSCQQNELKALDRMLVLAYQDEWFRQTSLYAAMQDWHQRHPAHGLLANP
jgi:Protein of unknown function (DUF4435)